MLALMSAPLVVGALGYAVFAWLLGAPLGVVVLVYIIAKGTGH
ncbi:MAG TPA: hypothetical protein VMD30_02100 [Tepidisphaeraceae bacterium]|nr:hypothetical protein [Tepidisphaeraceae bacterium]